MKVYFLKGPGGRGETVRNTLFGSAGIALGEACVVNHGDAEACRWRRKSRYAR